VPFQIFLQREAEVVASKREGDNFARCWIISVLQLFDGDTRPFCIHDYFLCFSYFRKFRSISPMLFLSLPLVVDVAFVLILRAEFYPLLRTFHT
jgi:hypothetical protein